MFDDKDLIENAKRVRNYLSMSGAPGAGLLDEALKPIEAGSAGPEDLAKLRAAAGAVFPTIDKPTLAAILAGTFVPGRTRRATGWISWLVNPTNVATALGFALMAASLYWTNWSTRASATIMSLDRVLEMQQSLDIEDIVRTRDLCGLGWTQLDPADLSRFMDATRKIGYFDAIWVSARNTAGTLDAQFMPLSQEMEKFAGIFSGEDATFDQGPMAFVSDPGKVCDLLGKGDGVEVRNAGTSLDIFANTYEDIARKLNLASGANLFRGAGAASIEVHKQRLQELQTIVHRWLLPALHGALGAMIFCLVRALREPFLVPLELRNVLLRFFFGAFVGYLVAALFVPSGMLGVLNGGQAPIASIAAFLFGYSIEAFLELLNRMNRFIAQPAAKERRPPPDRPGG